MTWAQERQANEAREAEVVLNALREACVASFARVADTFKKMDSSGNGSIDSNEFKNALRAVLGGGDGGPSDGALRGAFKRLDSDGSGSLSYAEVIKQLRLGRSSSGSGRGRTSTWVDKERIKPIPLREAKLSASDASLAQMTAKRIMLASAASEASLHSHRVHERSLTALASSRKSLVESSAQKVADGAARVAAVAEARERAIEQIAEKERLEFTRRHQSREHERREHERQKCEDELLMQRRAKQNHETIVVRKNAMLSARHARSDAALGVYEGGQQAHAARVNERRHEREAYLRKQAAAHAEKRDQVLKQQEAMRQVWTSLLHDFDLLAISSRSHRIPHPHISPPLSIVSQHLVSRTQPHTFSHLLRRTR